ncbi:MAG: c-type cytochrome biogenesis protein CcmI, partial [Acetobacteraceae bacterium]|nr:c-type cytochrome biogenesis protein CcmI [Acetobacteraceae bacterium]
LGFASLRPPSARGRREADLALYHRQLAELERERAAGRLDEVAHSAAVLEVQRRLLAAPGPAESDAPGAKAAATGRAPLLAPVVAVPPRAAVLYRANGNPGLPSATLAARQDGAAQEEQLLALLRQRLAAAPDPNGETARQGWMLLGNAERGRGRPDAAAEAYARALAIRFDAEIAGQRAQALLEADRTEEAARFLAETLPRAPDHIGLRFLTGLAEARAGRPETARTLWRALVAEAPPDAPWRAMVERRMQDLP